MKNRIKNGGKRWRHRAKLFPEEFKEKDRWEFATKVFLTTLKFAGAAFLLFFLIWLVFNPMKGYKGGRLFDDPVSGFECYLYAYTETDPVGERFIGNLDQGIMVVGIINANSVTDGCLQIPAYIGGIPVISVNLSSIYELKTRGVQVTSVQIPESVVYIECLQLEGVQEVTGCANVRIIKSSAFSGLDSLEYIESGNKLEAIEGGAFEDCAGLKEIRFGNNLRYIGNYAFANCTGLEKVEFGYGSMLGISKDAFGNTPWSKSETGRQFLKEEEYERQGTE